MALVVQDYATPWVDSQKTMMGFMHFAGPNDKVSRLHTDGSGELSAAARDVLWRHGAGTSQRGHCSCSPAYRTRFGAMQQLQCFPERNAFDKTDGDNTPYFLLHGVCFGVQVTPFGASVEYKPAPFEEKHAMQKSSPRANRGIFAGHPCRSGGDWS